MECCFQKCKFCKTFDWFRRSVLLNPFLSGFVPVVLKHILSTIAYAILCFLQKKVSQVNLGTWLPSLGGSQSLFCYHLPNLFDHVFLLRNTSICILLCPDSLKFMSFGVGLPMFKPQLYDLELIS